jgi:hypothetical protein
MYNTWSSATANVGLSAKVFDTALVGTGSGLAIILPNQIVADFTTVGGGYMKLNFRSEVALSSIYVMRGSMCKLYNMNITNPTPVTNSSGRYAGVVRQSINISTTSNTVFNATDLKFNLTSGKTYSLDCNILTTSQIATTGLTINVSNTATTSNVYVMYNTWSSATAKVGLSTNVFNTALVGTGSGLAIILPNQIVADFTTTSDGVLTVSGRSEVSGSRIDILRGSYCELYDMT